MSENGKWQDRVTETRRMRVGDLLPYKYNPKRHPASQMARIEAVLEKFGKVQGVIAWHSERNGGALTTFDGNARRNLDPDETWLVNITDLDDAEVDELVFYLDPLAGMSLHDEAAMAALMQDLGDVDGVLGEMLREIGTDAGVIVPDFQPVDIGEQPRLDQKKPVICPECGAEFVPKG
ncbi:MAG: hypothetical protein PVJ86_05425 [Phycisphaerales bacterium]|jgi:hypothetical protein